MVQRWDPYPRVESNSHYTYPDPTHTCEDGRDDTCDYYKTELSQYDESEFGIEVTHRPNRNPRVTDM